MTPAMTPEEHALEAWRKWTWWALNQYGFEREVAKYLDPEDTRLYEVLEDRFRAAIAEEREACAALAESKAGPGPWACKGPDDHDQHIEGWSPECIAAALRARA